MFGMQLSGPVVTVSQAEVTVTLQCSGTRRIEQIQDYPGDGDELINAVSPGACNAYMTLVLIRSNDSLGEKVQCEYLDGRSTCVADERWNQRDGRVPRSAAQEGAEDRVRWCTSRSSAP